MKWDPISRRMFLQGSGGFLLAIPVLPSLLPRKAQAAAMVAPVRYVAMSSQNGAVPSDLWFPSVAPSNKVLFRAAAASPKGAYYDAPPHYIYSGNISSNPITGISPLFDQKFHPFATKMNFIKGLDYDYGPSGNHVGAPLIGNLLNSTSNLTDYVNPFPTIDQIMAYAKDFYPNEGVGYVRSLNINLRHAGLFSFGFENPLTKSGNIVSLPTLYNVRQVFEILFPGMGDAKPQSPTPYIDKVLANFKTVRDGRAISSDDKHRLQNHIDLFADLEKKLSAVIDIVPGCESLTKPNETTPITLNTDATTIKNNYKAMNSLIALALKCQRTRVATFYISTIPGYEGLGGSGDGNWHEASHNVSSDVVADATSAKNTLQSIYKWISDNVLYDLVSKLDSVTDVDGKTLLDNCLVQYSSASMDYAHDHANMPVLTFGNAGGFLKTGQYLDYQNKDFNGRLGVNPGILFNKYLITAMQAVGLTPSDYDMTALGLTRGRYPNGVAGYGEHYIYRGPYYKNEAAYMGSRETIGELLPFMKA